MKNLIVDYIPFEISPEQINESMKENNGKLVVKGVLQRANAKNQNGRVYPMEILQREAKNYDEGFIKQKRALGELDHPDSSVVNLQNVSHNITEMHWEGDNLLGTCEILTTPSGNILRELFKNGTLIYEKDQRLNERDYGDLVGLNKAETADKFGKEQVQIWRRSYDTPPPNGESLKDVVKRVSPYFTKTIKPYLLDKKNVLIAAHGNSLRAIMIEVGMYKPEEISSIVFS